MKKLFLALILIITSCIANAGIPVIDVTNLAQNLISATEAVAQTAKQIQQYETQLKQYQDQLTNTAAPYSYVWDQAQQTMNQLRGSIDTLQYYRATFASVDGYLTQFRDLDAYRSVECHTQPWNCDAADKWASMSQKKATDAAYRGLEKQIDGLTGDAAQLERLQNSAQNAQGRMAAIQYANMLASQQANQLLQIRGLLVAQQNVLASRVQAQNDIEARHTAEGKRLRNGNVGRSNYVAW